MINKGPNHFFGRSWSFRRLVRWFVFHGLCNFTKLFMRELPQKPHPKSNVSHVFRGALKGCALAHPLNHTSPSFVLGLFEPHVLQTVEKYCGHDVIIYDVGANIGFHTLAFAKHASNGKVLAFEPNPTDNKILLWNISTNGIANVEVRKAAVSNQTGATKFATFAEPGVHHIAMGNEPRDAQIISVPSITLDDIVYAEKFQAPNLVKIDVEGGELLVLQGAQRMIRDFQPILIIEVWNQGREEVFKLMKSFGYIAANEYYIYGDSIVDIVFAPASLHNCTAEQIG